MIQYEPLSKEDRMNAQVDVRWKTDMEPKIRKLLGGYEASVRELEDELNGTDSWSGNPSKWGLRAMVEGLRGQLAMRDAEIAELKGKNMAVALPNKLLQNSSIHRHLL